MTISKTLLAFLLLSLSLVVSRSVFATPCVMQNPGWSQNFSWPNPLSVSATDPIGTVLATLIGHPEASYGGFVTADGGIFNSCSVDWYVRGASPGGGIWSTNVPGVGLRVTYDGAMVASEGSQKLSFFGPQRDFVRKPMKLELIKTGNVTSTSTLNTIWYYYNCNVCGVGNGGGPNDTYGMFMSVGSTQIQPAAPTCSLSISSATFNMGTLPTTAFNKGAGGTYDWVTDQSLRASSNCNATTASMTFAGTAAAAPYQRAFANRGNATGVALELWQSNGSQAIPNSGTPITFRAGANQNFTFSARYIQTAPTVTSGTVSATVTATVNYQ